MQRNSKENRISKDQLEENIRLVLLDADEAQLVAALSNLCAYAKNLEMQKAIVAGLQGTGKIRAYLKHENKKVRKNAARLLGAVGSADDLDALGEALQEEKALLVIPSILLSIGNIGTEKAEKILSEYSVPDAADETEEKNIREIREALEKAGNRFQKEKFRTVRKLDSERDILILAPEGFSEELSDEMKEKEIPHRRIQSGCIAHTDKIGKLYSLRCAAEILICLGKDVDPDPEKIAVYLIPEADLPYRIELKGFTGDRTKFIRTLSQLTGGRNNPSCYAQEFRIRMRKGKADIYKKLYSVKDSRYAYRKQTISASMQPATAACLVRFAKKHVPGREDANVLDPCCGSGTLLFERELYGPCRRLLGVDIKEETVRIARENAEAGRSKAGFIGKDLRKFRPDEPVDELYANLPFGNRVGSHAGNVELYEGLLKNLPQWLADDGFALLYTMEGKLLEDGIRKIKTLKILASTRTDAGGLKPRVFLLGKQHK